MITFVEVEKSCQGKHDKKAAQGYTILCIEVSIILRKKGLSIHQISRLTGISIAIVRKIT